MAEKTSPAEQSTAGVPQTLEIPNFMPSTEELTALEAVDEQKRTRRSFKGAHAFGTLPHPELAEESSRYEENDAGLGLRIALHFQDNLIWVPSKGQTGTWYFYKDGYWQEDAGGNHASTCARIVSAAAGQEELKYFLEDFREYREAVDAVEAAKSIGIAAVIKGAEEELQKVSATLLKDRLRWVSAIKTGTTHIHAALDAASSLLRKEASELDSRLDCINTPEGLLNLRTLKVSPSSPEHYCTRITAVPYRKGATHADVDTVFAWPEKSIPGAKAFFARYYGMALTGYHAKRFLYIDGDRDTGKSTLSEAVVHAMGDPEGSGYARIVAPVVFAARKGDSGEGASPALHEMRGARFVFSDEANGVGFMNSTLVKKLSSGGTINSRKLHGSVASWPSQVTMLLAGNGSMPMADDDAGLRERSLTAKLTTHLSPEEMDQGLENRMRERPQQEALFAFIADGAQAWLAEGATREALLVPQAILDSTAEHLKSADPLTEWLEEMVEMVDHDVAYLPLKTSAWAKIYNEWAKETHSAQQALKHFKARLDLRGIQTVDTQKIVDGYLSKGMLRVGMKLRDVEPAELYARRLVKLDRKSEVPAVLHFVPVQEAA